MPVIDLICGCHMKRAVWLSFFIITLYGTVVASAYPAKELHPGNSLTDEQLSPNRPASILLYNYFSSSIDPSVEDTNIYVTNVSLWRMIYVRILFFDTANCSFTSWSLALRANRTVSFRVSDIDPMTTGYILMVAIDQQGCPVRANDLLGGEFIRMESGYSSNLAAIGIPALNLGSPGAQGPPSCTLDGMTAELVFDGLQYSQLPRTLVVDNIMSVRDDNFVRLVLNPLGGDVTDRLLRIGDLEGLLFNDKAIAFYFRTTRDVCQLAETLRNGFPPTDIPFEDVISKGTTGWMLIYATGEMGLSGAVFKINSKGLNHGHNLSYTTTASRIVYKMPVFPPNREMSL